MTIALTLAGIALRRGDADAVDLFSLVAQRNDLREAWLGLAAARRRAGDPEGAAAALAEALSRHAWAPGLTATADAIAAGGPGWCALTGDGTLVLAAAAAPPAVSLDGRPLPGATAGRLPPGWDKAGAISVVARGRHLLGSPLDPRAITRTEGFVATPGESGADEGVRGWAWHPADPSRLPRITLRARAGAAITLEASGPVELAMAGPLARPQGFAVSAAQLARLGGGWLHVAGPDGRELAGSPVDPGAWRRDAARAASAVAARFPAGPAAARPDPAPPLLAPIAAEAQAAPVADVAPPADRSVDIVLALTRADGALDALAELLDGEALPVGRIIVVDDAVDDPALTAGLDALAGQRRIRLIRHAAALGRAASLQAGIDAAARRRDVVLLDPAARPAQGWLGALLAACDAGVGSVSPMDDARPAGKLAARVNAGVAVDVASGSELCVLVRRACLEAAGGLRTALFGQGHGAITDFSLRARHLGWRHVIAPGALLARAPMPGSAALAALTEANDRLLDRLHPGRDRLPDPALFAARRRLDAARWRRGRLDAAVLVLTHDRGGGVERRISALCARARADGQRPVVLRPAVMADGGPGCLVGEGIEGGFPDLRFAIPEELPALLRLLRGERPTLLQIHHLLGHAPAIADLPEKLGVAHEVHVHDYAWFCPRIALVGRDRRYCGEPDQRACERCVADCGRMIEEEIGVVALHRRSARLLRSATTVLAPSADTAARIRRHFPATRPVIAAWDDDFVFARPPPLRQQLRHVCVVGAIGTEKGYEVLLACARDARDRRLDLRFTVVGHSIDDRRLLDTGRVFVTGRYDDAEVVGLIAAQGAQAAWLPSVWPETWCYTLSHAWRAGLRVCAFDLGAQAERIRTTGLGWLLPLGLTPPSVNDALLALSN